MSSDKSGRTPAKPHLNFLRAMGAAFSADTAGTDLICRNHGIGRTLWHLVLFGILLSIPVTALHYLDVRSVISRGLQAFETEMGGAIVITPDGITPVRDPERPRDIAPLRGVRLIYSGKKDAVKLPPGIDDDFCLLFWTPRRFGLAMRTGKDAWRLMLYRPGEPELMISTGKSTMEKLLNLPMKPEAGPQVPQNLRINIGKLSSLMLMIYLFCHGIVTGVGLLLDILLFCTLYSLINMIFRRWDKFNVLSNREIWVLGIYCACPVMLITSLFKAVHVDLDHSGNNFIFCLIFFIYWQFLRHKINVLRQTPPRLNDKWSNDNEQR